LSPDRPERPLLGILGGLGPLASAAFVRTLYRLDPPEREQDAPRCILLSDPRFPDRTQALARGEEDLLTEHLTAALRTLVSAGAERIVIACFTVHAVLDRVPRELRERVVSLIDLAVDGVAALAPSDVPVLLLSTSGSRRSGLFTGHPRWGTVASRVRLPADADQEELHRRLYELKQGRAPESMLPWLEELCTRYEVSGFVFGCTELHLVRESVCRIGDWRIIDPLLRAARTLA